ncbi:MAG: cysteine--tRNA ligase [Rhodospirillaceae bacterium]|nr:cysteine--tRNA ligase [Rhodospirillaceae bacterium]
MALHLHNTLTRTRERFEPQNPERVTMYVCGPTVYSFAHIGNARPCVVFDVLARLLRRSYGLVYVRNVTDVDDKINEAAREEGVPISVLTARYLAAFHEDMGSLGVLPPDVEPKATEHLPDISTLVERLLEAGHAYEADGHVLFSVPSFDDYGALSGRSQDDLIAGARVKVESYKRNPADFVLWKPSSANGVGWDSPWGYGRPGWHAECSAMVQAHLGETIDIHGGGLDLIFPHHENETAQSTCAYGVQRYCRYWVHNGLVDVSGEKMSKSLGNVLLVRNLLDEAPGEAVRLGLLTAHYRQPLDWNSAVLEDARQKLDKMYGALRNAGVTGPAKGDRPPDDPAADPPRGVIEALEDDLNTPRALAEMFGVVRQLNSESDPDRRSALARELRAGGWLLGLLQDDPEAWFTADRGVDDPGDEWIDAMVQEREAVRRARNFAEADRIRDELASLGILVEDRTEGPRWRRARQ